MKKLYVAYIFGGVAIALAILSAVLYICGNDDGRILGAISTIMSVAISILAMFYSSKTGAQTSALLKEIKDQNNSFICLIKQELIKGSYVSPNIKNDASSKSVMDI